MKKSLRALSKTSAVVLALAAVLVCAAHALGGAADANVRVWEDWIELPTYTEGAPNPNPPFDLFSLTRFNYPYTIRDALTERPVPQRWRAHSRIWRFVSPRSARLARSQSRDRRDARTLSDLGSRYRTVCTRRNRAWL